ncbi:MAG: hypothetical protein WD402_10575 [Chloroflexota bacterium]
MNLGQAASVVQMGLVAGVLAFAGFGVLQPPPITEHTRSLEFGSALVGLALLAAITGWAISGGARWGRFLGWLVAIVCAVAGAFGIYGLVAFLADPEVFSRSNLAVLAVLLFMGVTSIVLVAVPLGERHSQEVLSSFIQRKRLTWLASGFVIGIAVSAAFGAFLSTVPELPCCPA